jgi:N-methylhydantoinase A
VSTRIGVDVGGTFTDLIAYDPGSGMVVSAKCPSTTDAPERAVIQTLTSAVAPEYVSTCEYFLHGTTVGLNALLQRSGARVGLLATCGFRDVLEIRRGSREEMLNLWWRPPAPLVPRRLRIPIRERTLADGTIDTLLNDGDIADAVDVFAGEGVDTVAIAFINAYRNPANELAAAESLRSHGFDGEISLSHQVSGEYREFERTSTTVIDAYVRRVTGAYLERLAAGLKKLDSPATMLMMRSGGGAMTFDEAATRPFETIISGPVAGAEGAATMASQLYLDQVIAADVGGTSFDVSVILHGRPQTLNQGDVIGFPVQAPWVDVRSIGAGGGSIAEIDPGGLLRVGPRSAGSAPGPACYSRGGTEPTVTDAAFALGMLGDGHLASGIQLDHKLALGALATLEDTLSMQSHAVAAGIMRVAAAHMVDAIHEITVERGLDPRDGALMVFGGAGGLFATLLASESGVATTVIPPYCGNFSAWGLLGADIAQSAARTTILPLAERSTAVEAEQIFSRLLDDLRRRPSHNGSNDAATDAALDLRYKGQEYSLTIAVPTTDGRISADTEDIATRFENEYEKIFGHRMDEDIEVVAVRATLRTLLPRRQNDALPPPSSTPPSQSTLEAFSFTANARIAFSVLNRDSLTAGTSIIGPSLILEETSTTYLDKGFQADVHPTGCLMVTAADRKSFNA